MKSELKNFKEAVKIKYPVLMITDDESLVVLAVSKIKNIVLHDSDGDYEIGDTAKKIDLTTAVPFTGELIISN